MKIELRGHHVEVFRKYYSARPDNFDEVINEIKPNDFLEYLSQIDSDVPEIG